MDYTLVELDTEYNEACRAVLELLGDLDAIEILRAHTPAGRRYLLDRLETSLRLIDRIDRELEDGNECLLNT